MKKILFLLSIPLLLSCSNKTEQAVYMEQLPNGQEVMVCDYAKVSPEIIEVPLSTFIDECHMVPLENKTEAFIKPNGTFFSENYIGVKSYGGISYKLFNYQGKLIRDIGKVGKGPGEYPNVYSHQIDEKNNSIYMLPWSTDKVITFDTLGNSLKGIPLHHQIQRGHFISQKDHFTVINLPSEPYPYSVFNQDKNGKLLSSSLNNPKDLDSDFRDRAFHLNNTSNIDVYHMHYFNCKNDSLYHYDPKSNKLHPKFTMKFQGEDIPVHSYTELPRFLIIDIFRLKEVRPGVQVSSDRKYVLIDKEKRTACHMVLKNDFYGGINTWPQFENGYFFNNMPAINLKKEIDLLFTYSKEMDEGMKIKMETINQQINKEDNNVVFWGRLAN